MSKKPPAPKARLSGFCNPTLPRTAEYDPHQRCPGCDCTAANCPCSPESDPPMNDTTPATTIRHEGGLVYVDVTEPAPDTSTPAGVIEAARDLADLLGRIMLDYHAEDWRDAVRLLRDLRAVTSELGKVDAQLVRWLYLHGEHGHHMQIDGVSGNVAIGRGRAKTKWDAREAVFDYVGARITANDGEMPDPNVVADWVMEVVPATPSTALRKTPLKDAGLDPKDYYVDEPGTIQVTILT